MSTIFVFSVNAFGLVRLHFSEVSLRSVYLCYFFLQIALFWFTLHYDDAVSLCKQPSLSHPVENRQHHVELLLLLFLCHVARWVAELREETAQVHWVPARCPVGCTPPAVASPWSSSPYSFSEASWGRSQPWQSRQKRGFVKWRMVRRGKNNKKSGKLIVDCERPLLMWRDMLDSNCRSNSACLFFDVKCFCLRTFSEDSAAGTEILQDTQTKLDPRYYLGSFQGHSD